MSEKDREYYRQTWGFDPVADARPSHEHYPDPALKDTPETPEHPHSKVRGDYCYIKEFPLEADWDLNAVGVRIQAGVEVFGEQIQNVIKFLRRGKGNQQGRKAEITCTHTVVYAGPATQALSLAKDSLLQEPYPPEIRGILSRAGGPVKLPPWEHFAAMKSYVAAIAEIGIGNILRGAFAATDGGILCQSFGFNSAMQAQVIRALRYIAPSTTRALLRDFFLEIADHVDREWLNGRFPALDETYGFSSVFLSHFETFQAVEAKIDVQLWQDALVNCKKPDLEVCSFIECKLKP